MIVVTQENPGGSSRRYGSATSRRNARSPELRSGISELTRCSASLRMNHFAGTRSSLCLPASDVRAPTTWSTVGSASSVATSSGICAVRVGHVGVGPDDDVTPGLLGANPAHRAGAAVAWEMHHPQVRETGSASRSRASVASVEASSTAISS